MSEHPIEGLMETAMNSIKDMIDVNTIIGEPIETSNGMVIIPISKVSVGFAAGGSEFKGETVDPVAFVIVQKDSIKVLPIEHNSAIEKLMDYVPDLMEKADSIMDKTLDNQDKPKDKEQKNSVTKKGKLIKKIKSK